MDIGLFFFVEPFCYREIENTGFSRKEFVSFEMFDTDKTCHIINYRAVWMSARFISYVI